MTAEAIKWIWWLIATCGFAGTIALLVFFPTVVPMILRGIVKFFQWVLSYRIGCALLAAIIAGIAADDHRHTIDDAATAQRTAEFEQAQTARDADIAKKTRDEVWTEIANETAAATITDTEVKEFHDALPPVPAVGNPFAVGPSADKLRRIAGQAVRRPGGPQGVSAARRAGQRLLHRGSKRL